MPSLEIAEDEWPLLIDMVRESQPEAPEWACLAVMFNLCIDSIITPLSVELWNLYCRLGGLQNEGYQSYLRLPALVVQAFEIIDGEADRIRKLREKNARKQT